MLGFERPVVFAADDLYHRAHEAVIMCDVVITLKGLIDQEMQVAVLCMTEHRAIWIPKLCEELLQVRHRFGETVDREDHIFVDTGASWSARPANG